MNERAGRKAARDLVTRAGYRVGGHLGRKSDEDSDEKLVSSGVHQHERSMHPGRSETKLHFRDGGAASGGTAPQRGDRASRRSKDHAGPKINILVAGGPRPDSGMQGPPPGSAVPAPPHPAAPAAPPPAAHPPMPPQGMPPAMMPVPVPTPQPGGAPPPRPLKSGGSAGRIKMTAGANSGQGRLEKARGLSY